ncbi:MAG: FAD-binding domain-containing protein [Cyclobacteriaceae bacterium]|nr:FAD-binding domain-containing protein [Cyclobacteriaceae bacterium]
MNELFPRSERKISFPTNYTSIIERISKINPVQYGKSRNFIDGAVTYLSPYISRGVISVKQVQEAVLAKGHHPSTIEKFLQELAWREYFQRVWQAKGDALFQDMKQSQADVVHRRMIKAIADAKTGISVIDELIQEFYETGYMHNHVRMYVASIASNIGKAHWSAPSHWMYYHLLDGDLASNTCSWQWVAGAFSSKKYYCNQENINRYTHSHQQNTFLDLTTESLSNTPVPEILKSTVELELRTQLPNLPKPTIDTSKPTLVYNSYNLDPIWRKEDDFNRILLLEPSHFKRFPVSEKVIDFVIALSKNISGIQIMVGEVSELSDPYRNSELGTNALISKEHPAFRYYPGLKDERDWMFPEVKGYFNSFFSFWNKCSPFVY